MEINKQLGAVVLCGGASRRMGLDKWKLPVGPQTPDGAPTILDRIVQTLSLRAGGIVISAQRGRENESCETSRQIQGTELVYDEHQGAGPLEGIRCGLAALEPRFPFAMVVACDIPFFDARVIDCLWSHLHDFDAVIPVEGKRLFGMTAIYRTSSHHRMKEMLVTGSRRVSQLPSIMTACLLPSEELRVCDPDLRCLQNINSPEDYFRLLTEMGLKCDPELRDQLLRGQN